MAVLGAAITPPCVRGRDGCRVFFDPQRQPMGVWEDAGVAFDEDRQWRSRTRLIRPTSEEYAIMKG